MLCSITVILLQKIICELLCLFQVFQRAAPRLMVQRKVRDPASRRHPIQKPSLSQHFNTRLRQRQRPLPHRGLPKSFSFSRIAWYGPCTGISRRFSTGKISSATSQQLAIASLPVGHLKVSHHAAAIIILSHISLLPLKITSKRSHAPNLQWIFALVVRWVWIPPCVRWTRRAPSPRWTIGMMELQLDRFSDGDSVN